MEREVSNPIEPEAIPPKHSTFSSKTPQNGPPPEFPVVGIGASAGGLEAFEQFFTGLPAETGMSFVLVQHLSPPHKSILPEIIQRFTSMPVSQVVDGIPVQPNCVYVIPPGVDLALIDSHLTLLKPEAAHGFRLPIDFFFRSLAQDLHERAIGIVLSGTGSDGSLGVKSIKAEGGLTIAQTLESAAFQDMPRNAVATQDVDFVLPPGKMGELILKVAHHELIVEDEKRENESPVPTQGMQKLYLLLHAKTGHDFSLYKQATLRRRIERRMKINLIKNLEEYIGYLEDHPQEIDALFREMLIHVTNFFRDPSAFHALIEKGIAPLIRERQENQTPLRVWVAGCSTGEEAYSIAIAIQEQIDAKKMDFPVQIYATDIDADAIAAARSGHYPEGITEDVSQERLQRFFQPEDSGYRIKKMIRDQVIFAIQNIISDPPFSKIDLLCCRNLLIYLEPELQNQLFPLFHQALSPQGVLFLGNSESISGFNHLFTSLDRKHKLFHRAEVLTPSHLPTRFRMSRLAAVSPAAPPAGPGQTSSGRLREWTEKTLLDFHTPACVVIDEKHNLIFVHGHTGKFLEPAPGENHSDLVRMAREGLKAELATALHAASVQGEKVRRTGIQVKTNGDYQAVTLTVQPIQVPSEFLGLTLVVFEEEPAPSVEALHSSSKEKAKSRRLGELEKRLKETEAYLQTIIDELETTNQDLKSANEELQSTNEEMQSTNEEMETSKEELQSSNEELTTINAELQKKNEELAGLNNDVFNLLASTDIGTLFLDLDLNVRRFTPAVNRLYNFISGDQGRPVEHFVSRLDYDHLVDDVRQVLATLISLAVEKQTRDGSAWYLVSIKPYRTLENTVDGVVITFVEITEQKRGDELRRLGTILRDSNDAVTVQDFSGKILAWNRGAVQMYGWNETDAMRMNAFDMIPEPNRAETKALLERLSHRETLGPLETQRITRDGRTLDVLVTLTALVDDAGRPAAVATTERDITERKWDMQRLMFGNRALKALTHIYKTALTSAKPASRAAETCRALVDEAGYRLAWIGHIQPAKSNKIFPACWAGLAADDPHPQETIQNLAKAAWGSIEDALNSGRPRVMCNIPFDFAEGQKHTLGSFIVLPLRTEKGHSSVLVVYADEPQAFPDEAVQSLVMISENIGQPIKAS